MEELLKELGYTDEQIKAILEGMKNKKIYTSGEENADLRIQKLNEDFTGKEIELTKANELIKQLQGSNKDNEGLQSKITEYEQEIESLKAQQQEKDIENALKLELLKNKAKPDDIDYLIFKIKTNKQENEKFETDENGNLKNFNVDDIKKEYKNNFEDKLTEKVDVKKLGGIGSLENEGEQKPDTLLGALKERYSNNGDL